MIKSSKLKSSKKTPRNIYQPNSRVSDMVKNIFCDKKDLVNESDVEQFFVIRLLKKLGFKDKDIKTKKSIEELTIGRGSRKEKYKPDYVLFIKKKPKIVIDAKEPNEKIDDYLYQTSGYSLSLNQKFDNENPIEYFILTNGLILKLFKWDKEKPILTLKFEDFIEDNSEYIKLLQIISYDSFKEKVEIDLEKFDFFRPEIKELEGIFRACHNLIWKKEKIKPTEAFYEFSKLFFVKLYYDRKMHDLMKERKPKKEDFIFSVSWIEKTEKEESHPFDTILFKNLRELMENEIKEKQRRRIFEKNERLNLKPSTTKEVVRLLENYDLFGIDEDLNGRMFETFLNATVRGKDLGQFFTPRSVVKFMTELADIKVSKDKIDNILDGLCGSGGFLIEAMAKMFNKVIKNNSLTTSEKEKLKDWIVKEKLWGTDANKNISRIARMNMYLHGDGSNRIFWLPDFLDKKVSIEKGINPELREDAEEFKRITVDENFKFDIVLSNPPFSMKYETKNKEEKKILEEYDIAYVDGRENSNKIKSSLKSNVLSIERYKDLLKPNGKLITIIDESVLNADTESKYRDFIKKHFIIKAVISLPRNTFINAETGVKTSILYLVKRGKEKEEQPDIFMAISENVGHTDSGKPCPDKNDLNKILEAFRRFENGEL